uniref:sugar kinase n=1 Tax=Ningiella ruwaisensis TaxID=2364274 RepID=UPI00109FD758|nr:sugar kinase [Ningiella ruwaisensis]
MSNKSIACLGECMLELSAAGDDLFKMRYGGDVLNTAVYLSRLGSKVSVVTAMGQDKRSQNVISKWQKEGLDVDAVFQDEQRLPGMYLIETDEYGERSFYYWRKESAARQMFQLSTAYFQSLIKHDIIYFTGITLSLLSATTYSAFINMLMRLKEAGKQVAFDLNYRPANWRSAQNAISNIEDVLPYLDIIFPSYDDHLVLHPKHSKKNAVNYYDEFGIGTIVLKNGADGCYVKASNTDRIQHFPTLPITPIDTTAAGDAFNAGYLHAYMKDGKVSKCVELAQKVASVVIQHPGAIIQPDSFNQAFNAQETSLKTGAL